MVYKQAWSIKNCKYVWDVLAGQTIVTSKKRHSSMVCDCWPASEGFSYPWFVKGKVGRSAKLYKRACICQLFKNSEPLSTCLVWKIARTPLPIVDRNNHLLKQFLSLFYKWKALAHVKTLLPSAKGLSFTFMLCLHILPFMHRLREHSCHFEYNVHGPKIYYWLIHNYGNACSQIICI
jgi:hypothetical protein